MKFIEYMKETPFIHVSVGGVTAHVPSPPEDSLPATRNRPSGVPCRHRRTRDGIPATVPLRSRRLLLHRRGRKVLGDPRADCSMNHDLLPGRRGNGPSAPGAAPAPHPCPGIDIEPRVRRDSFRKEPFCTHKCDRTPLRRDPMVQRHATIAPGMLGRKPAEFADSGISRLPRLRQQHGRKTMRNFLTTALLLLVSTTALAGNGITCLMPPPPDGSSGTQPPSTFPIEYFVFNGTRSSDAETMTQDTYHRLVNEHSGFFQAYPPELEVFHDPTPSSPLSQVRRTAVDGVPPSYSVTAISYKDWMPWA